MTRYRAVRDGAAATLGVGLVGAILPLLGALAGAVAGGLVTGARSSDDQRLVNGLLATGAGAVAPMHAALLVVRLAGGVNPPDVTAAWVVSEAPAVTPTAVAGAAALGVVGALVARFATGSSDVDAKARDGTGGTWK
jgi:hypothetical protein